MGSRFLLFAQLRPQKAGIVPKNLMQ